MLKGGGQPIVLGTFQCQGNITNFENRRTRVYGACSKYWWGCANGAGYLQVPGQLTNFENRRTRAYCACSKY